jgi:Septum formation
MKRVGIVAAGVALALGGCGARPPAGTDGDLTNAWPAMPAAQLVVPVAGACHANRYSDSSDAPLITESFAGPVVDCATDHEFETAFVGAFTGPDAATPAPPAQDSAALRGAYVACEANAAQYLGGDWRAAPVWVSLVVPSTGEWHVGARWFRCDLGHMASPLKGLGIMRTGSVKDGLRGSRPLAITCLTAEQDSTGDIYQTAPADCNAPHQAEFVGIYVAPEGAWPMADDGAALARSGCLKAIGHFLGFTDATDWSNPTIGYLTGDFDRHRWDLGDRSVRCFAYAWTKNKTIVGSVRGIRSTPARSA